MIAAYLAFREITATTHNGVKTYFNKELVKAELIDKELGLAYNSLFALRQEADYEDFRLTYKEDVERLQPLVQRLLDGVEALISD